MKEWNQHLIFYLKMLPAALKKRCIQVARLPENVTAKAKEVLQQLEASYQPAESVKELPSPTNFPHEDKEESHQRCRRRADDVVWVKSEAAQSQISAKL